MKFRIGSVVALLALITLIFSTSTFAGGGKNQIKNQGKKGKGTVSTGSTAQGSASQSRAGR
jgi:hypothetical protein